MRSFREGSENKINKAEGLDFFMGRAKLIDSKSVSVEMKNGNDKTLSAEHIFINTGTRPRIPEIRGIENVPYLTSTTIMELDIVPDHLLIIGGGYIGLEFGQMFKRFGSDVAIVHHGPRLLMREDPDIAEEVLKIIKEDGIEVMLDTNPTEARIVKERGIELTLNPHLS